METPASNAGVFWPHNPLKMTAAKDSSKNLPVAASIFGGSIVSFHAQSYPNLPLETPVQPF
jgi:hypothetical protein